MFCRGIRGATTADDNTSEAILTATRQMLALIIRSNGVQKEDVASALFTVTPDLNAEFPALAARQLGWMDVPLICAHEVAVPGSLSHCIRVLVMWNTDKRADEVAHVYIKNAANLRPDWANLPPVDWSDLEHWISDNLNKAARPAR